MLAVRWMESVTATISSPLGVLGTEGSVVPATPLIVAVVVGTTFGGPAFTAALGAAPMAGAFAAEIVPNSVQLMPSGLPSIATIPPAPNVPEAVNFAWRTMPGG